MRLTVNVPDDIGTGGDANKSSRVAHTERISGTKDITTADQTINVQDEKETVR